MVIIIERIIQEGSQAPVKIILRWLQQVVVYLDWLAVLDPFIVVLFCGPTCFISLPVTTVVTGRVIRVSYPWSPMSAL